MHLFSEFNPIANNVRVYFLFPKWYINGGRNSSRQLGTSIEDFSQLLQPTYKGAWDHWKHAAPDSAVFPRAHSGSPKIKHYLCPQSMFSCGFSIIITIFVGLLRGMRSLLKIHEASSTKMSISLRLSLFLLLIRSSQPCLNSAAATLQP